MTGFGAFPGAPFNPSQTIVRALDRHSRTRFKRSGIDLEIAILPVVFHAIPDHLQAIKSQHNPDVVLHLGLAARRRSISIEKRALNHLSQLHCDAHGKRAQAHRIDLCAPNIRPVTLPVQSIKQAMSGPGLRIALSQDAGDYICNQTLFLSLGLFPQASFIHLPKPLRLTKPVRQGHQKGQQKTKALHLARMVDGVERAILFLGRPSLRAPDLI